VPEDGAGAVDPDETVPVGGAPLLESAESPAPALGSLTSTVVVFVPATRFTW
jgi:hypothetical protein